MNTTKSQPAHLVPAAFSRGRNQTINHKTQLNMKYSRPAGQPTATNSINILERIQSKIEEKMTRADTSNAHGNGSLFYRNAGAVDKKSSTSIGGPRRCPNL